MLVLRLMKKMGDTINRYVEKTEGYTFDFVKEVIEAMYIGGLSEEDAFNRINEAIESKGNYKTTEDNFNKLGF